MTNATIIHPDYFYISGFSGIPHTKYFYAFLCFVYALTVLGNTFVMLMICMNKCLHSPKYIVVFNLALSDLCESFCDHAPTYRLACNDNTADRVINWTHPVIILWFPVLFIIVTYISIARALFKIATASERLKAIKTCTSHLVLVSVFYFPLLITLAMDSLMDQNTRMINLSLATLLPPMLDPIIYSLMTEEFRESIKKLYRRKTDTYH